MADKDKNTNTPVDETPVNEVDQNSPAELEEAKNDPNPQMQAEVDKPVGEGQNLYFFPDIQKSVVASSMEEAVSMVQADLDALKSEENK